MISSISQVLPFVAVPVYLNATWTLDDKNDRRLTSPEFTQLHAPEDKIGDISIQTGHPLNNMDDLHTVTLYLNPDRQTEYYDYLIALKPKRIIFNPGTENPFLKKLARENNIETEEACTLVLLSLGAY